MADQITYIYNKMHKTGLNSNIETLTFNTEGFSTPNPGQMSWNPDQGTLDLKLYSDAKLQIGEETYYYGVAGAPKGTADNSSYANDDGNITNGQVVMIDGSDGAGRLLLRKAYYPQINNDPTLLIGVATTDMPSGEYGYVTWFGFVNDIATAQHAIEGQNTVVLYFNPALNYVTNLQSGLINTRPAYPNLAIPVATVTFLDTGINNGKIFVRPNNSYRLTDITDIDFTGLADQWVIKYDQPNNKWKVASTDFNLTDVGSSANVANEMVKRDGLGSFAAQDITAEGSFIGDLTGDVNADLISATGLATFSAGIAANGGSLTTNTDTFNLLQTNAITLNIGAQSTAITLGGATTSSANNFANGATASGSVKTVNIGRNGVAGSTTNINMGSTNNSTINLYGTIKQPAVSASCQVTKSDTIYTIWSGTQTAYNALGTYDTNTLYYIIG